MSSPDLGEIIRLENGSATWATVDEPTRRAEEMGLPRRDARRYDARVGSADPARVPDPGAIVVSESRSQIGILFGFLSLAFAVALARGVTGAQSASGRAAVAVIFGILVLACVRAWIMMIRRPARLEIAGDVIRYVPRHGPVSTLSRQQGDELRFVKRQQGPRIWALELTIAGSGTGIVLGFFSRKAVRQACLTRGWRFDAQIRRSRA